ncbi:MAG TPA: twin-arginine translocase TatA/TatE family subunit [Acidimicrobiales bacterium]
MITAFLEGPDLIIVLVIVVVLFGSTKLPQLARSLGQAKSELDAGLRHEPEAAPAASPPTPPG